MCDDDLKSLKITRTANRVQDTNEISEQVCLTDKQGGYSATRSIAATKKLEKKIPKLNYVDPTIMSRITHAVSNYKNLAKSSIPSKFGEQASIMNPNLVNAHCSPNNRSNYPEPGDLAERNIPLALMNKKRKIIKQLDLMKEEAKKKLNCEVEEIYAGIRENPELEDEMNETLDFLNLEYNNTINMINMNREKLERSYMSIANNKNISAQIPNEIKNIEKNVFSRFGQSELAQVILSPRILRSRTPSPDSLVDRSRKFKNRTKDMQLNEALQKKKKYARYNAATSKAESFRQAMQADQTNRAAMHQQAALAGSRSSTSAEIDSKFSASESASAIRTIRRKNKVTKHERNENEKNNDRPCGTESLSQINSTSRIAQMKITNKQPTDIVCSEIRNAERAQQLVTARNLAVEFDRLSKQQASAANKCASKKLMINKPPTIKTPNIPSGSTFAQEAEEARRLKRAFQAGQIRIAAKEQNRSALRQTDVRPFIDPQIAAEAKCSANRNLQRSLGLTVQRHDEAKKVTQKRSIYGTNSKASSIVSKNSVKQMYDKQPELTELQRKMKQAKHISDVRKLYQQRSRANFRGTKFPLDSRSETEQAARNAKRKPCLKPKPSVINDEIVRAEKVRQTLESRKIANEQHQATYRHDVTANILDPKLVIDAKASNIRNLQLRTLSKPPTDVAEETMRAEIAKAFLEARKLAATRPRNSLDKRAAKFSEKIEKSEQFPVVKTELERENERLKRIEEARTYADQISDTSIRSFMSRAESSVPKLKTTSSARSHSGFFAGPEEDEQIKILIAQTNLGPIHKLKKLEDDIVDKYAAMKENAFSEIAASTKRFAVDEKLEQNRIASQIREATDFLDLEKRIKLDIIAVIKDELKRLDIQFIDKAKVLQAESDEKKEYDSGLKFLYDELVEKKLLSIKKGINDLKSPCCTEDRPSRSVYTLESKLSDVYKSHGFSPPKKNVLPQKKLQMSKWNASEDILVQKQKILSCLETAIKETKNNKEFLENILTPLKRTPSIVLNESIQTAVFKEKESAVDKIAEVSKKQAKRMHLMNDLKTMPSDFPNISNLEGENEENIFEMVMNKQHGLNHLAPPHNFVEALVNTDTPKIKVIGNSVERPTNEIVPLSIPTTALNSANVLPGDDIDISIKMNQTDELPKTDIAAQTLRNEIPEIRLNQKPEYNVNETEVPMTVNSYSYESYFQVRGTAKPAWFPGYFSVMPSDQGVSLFVKNSASEVLQDAWERMKPDFEV